MSKALDAYLKSIESLKDIENLVYEDIYRKIAKHIQLGSMYIFIRIGKYNLSRNNEDHIITRLQEDGFQVINSGLYPPGLAISWDEPVGYDYVVNGAKYNEAKKALEN